MKKSIIVFLILICSAMPVFGQQVTKADIQSLDAKLTKLQETLMEMNKTITTMDKSLTAVEIKVTEMDKRLTIQIDELDKRQTTQITEMDKRQTTQIGELDKRLSSQIASLYSFVRWAISILTLVVLAVIALPQVFGYLQDKREREELRKEVEVLKQEFAQFKTLMFTRSSAN